MTSEAHVETTFSDKRQPGVIDVMLWTAGFACVAFTMCYAYHIGLLAPPARQRLLSPRVSAC